jgi:hypothetical protein
VRGSSTSSTHYALQLRNDHAENTLLISQYLGIPESQNGVAIGSERGIARAVPGIICMLSTINFDDEPLLATNEVDDVRCDSFLPHEFEAPQPSVAQRKQQLRFSIGGLAAKASL